MTSTTMPGSVQPFDNENDISYSGNGLANLPFNSYRHNRRDVIDLSGGGGMIDTSSSHIETLIQPSGELVDLGLEPELILGETGGGLERQRYNNNNNNNDNGIY